MPVHRILPGTLEAKKRDKLVADLANELADRPSTRPPKQPVIFEEEVPRTDTYHVMVVWEGWRAVPTKERGSIILDAYEKSKPDVAPKITVTLGVTLDEALSMDLLPYQVSEVRRGKNDPSYKQLRAAMAEEGAFETFAGPRLYYPTLEAAEEARERLLKRVPGSQWNILQGQEVPES